MQEPKKTSKKEKLKQKQKTDTRINSIFLCSHDTHLKLTKPSKNPPNCKSCGFKLSGSSGYLICANNKPCYQLCSSCKVCKSNHFLGKIYSMKIYDKNQLYSKNMFNCTSCKQQKQVTNEGLYYCSPCDFALCIDCIKNEQKIWRQ